MKNKNVVNRSRLLSGGRTLSKDVCLQLLGCCGRRSAVAIAILVVIFSCQKSQDQGTALATSSDPLPSWNNGAVKKAIMAYVAKVTQAGSPDFIPEQDRIATFDNDGTLLAEKPYVQELFVLYRVKKMVSEDPRLMKREPFKAVVTKDKEYFKKNGERAVVELLAATHANLTEEQFENAVNDFIVNTKFPGLDVPLNQITYQPQIELLRYLRNNGFKTYICTGGTIEFVRQISEKFYGIPKEQVIGSTFKYQFADSANAIFRQPVLNHFNDKQAKPVGIQYHIGRRPVFACGNEGGGGDIYMLRYTQGSKYPSFQLIIDHDDDQREFAYEEPDSISLRWAKKYKWYVVSIKKDWKNVFVK